MARQLRTPRPLTDPKADEFIERIKNLKPYEEPVVQRITATTSDVPAVFYKPTNTMFFCTDAGAFALGPDGTWRPIKPLR